ncbi:MAG: glycosyltransferase [Bacteroidales bacterium]|nr:glycosyltransferase [Bacteroidales bacterium]
MTLKILFWIFLGIVFYAYVGYTILLLLVTLFRFVFFRKNKTTAGLTEPEVTLCIPAYNEEKFVIEKVNNCMDLDYPAEKLNILWITDGSNDNTNELLCRYPEIKVMHEYERKGKIHAMNRGMKMIETPFVVFTDANTMLNREALKEIIKPFADLKTGCVTGEKRVGELGLQKAVSAGEGLYWQYESLIKRLESETGSVVGAVGEIFALRLEYYEEVSDDTILDDFTLSLQMVRKGYRVKYAPKAWGKESASLNIAEEIKRKVRIAVGGLQTLTRMTDLLNPLKYGFLTVKYISHKVLRWTIVPLLFPVVILLNLLIVISPYNSIVYTCIFILQCLFYLLVLWGSSIKDQRIRPKALFAPYYLFIMNYAIVKGFFAFLSGNYSVKWPKVKRS